jgi:hypothetical protein
MICTYIIISYIQTECKGRGGSKYAYAYAVWNKLSVQKVLLSPRNIQTDMGLHTNDFPMDRISGLTTLKNCITL